MNFIEKLSDIEFDRQRGTLNLIASENYPSPKVLELLGSVWQNKYAEGYPGKRYYAGNVNSDELESFVQQKALEVFDPTGEYGANVQVLSGSPANAMVYLAMLGPGDTVLSPDLSQAGHLSHLQPTSAYAKFFRPLSYGVKEVSPNNFEIDWDAVEQKLEEEKPKLAIIGFSGYPPKYEFARFCRAAHKAGTLVLADIAHINGLIAAGLHDLPFKKGDDGADFVSMTTHKTLRGPRAAMLFAKSDYIDRINKTVFPGTSGGPHLHQIAATGQALLEITGEDQYPDRVPFADYSQNIIDTCKALENSLKSSGLEIISPTGTHLCFVKLPSGSDSLEVQQKLETAGIITNRNLIPGDTKTAWRPSGLRLGTAALASRGLTANQATRIGEWIAAVVAGETIKSLEVAELAGKLNWWYKR